MTIGHNQIAGDRLRSFIERVERLEGEQKALADDKREVFAEAKSAGFDTKIMRQILRERKLDPAERAEQQDLLEIYRDAIGFNTTPLGGSTESDKQGQMR